MSEALPPKDGHRHASVTPIRRAKIRKKNREAVERARETIALAHHAMANARQLIKEAAEIFQYNKARREHKAEQGRQENRPEMRHNRIVPLAPSGSVEAYGKGRQGKKGVARLTGQWRSWIPPKGVTAQPMCIGSRDGYQCRPQPKAEGLKARKKLRPTIAKPLRLRNANKPNPGSCGPR